MTTLLEEDHGPVDDLGRGARRRRTTTWVGLLSAALAVSLPVAVTVGPVDLDALTVLRIVGHHALGVPSTVTWDASTDSIVWLVRAPRVLLAALVGALLALAGVALQALTRNVLAEPYLLGVSSGASTGAALTILFGVGIGTGSAALTGSAFLGALVASAMVFVLARDQGRVTSIRLVLAGVAVGYVLSAATSFLVFASDTPEGARAVLFWLLGSLARASWATVVVAALALVALLAVLGWLARSLDALSIGEETAHALGARPSRVRVVTLVAVAVAVGAAVAVSGGIGFVGLVVPHVARLCVGTVHRVLLPVSALIGAVFLVWADVVARTLLAPQELPIGIVTAVVGAPFLFVLVRRVQRGAMA